MPGLLLFAKHPFKTSFLRVNKQVEESPGAGYTDGINTILRQVNQYKKPLLMAVFLAIGIVAFEVWQVGSIAGDSGVLGGPGRSAPGMQADDQLAATFVAFPTLGNSEDFAGEDIEDQQGIGGSPAASFRDQSQPLGANRGGVITYRVNHGDTLSQIAGDFGISVQTITAANPEIRAQALQIGQELVILPVSGIIYHVRGGETLESVAELFNISPSHIREFNKTVDFEDLGAGASLVIPGAKPRNQYVGGPSLPDIGTYFTQPTLGFNWGRLHKYNAVDIANACGTRIVASAEGLVVDASSGGWNSGYGHYVLIEHPNDTKTRYAHLGDVLVKIGDYAKQGQEIGEMGNTGNVHGPTGCHLHFEIYGAKNSFARF